MARSTMVCAQSSQCPATSCPSCLTGTSRGPGWGPPRDSVAAGTGLRFSLIVVCYVWT